MNKLLLSMAALPLVIGGLSVTASADEGISILNDVKLKGEIRPRYEYAALKGNGKEAAEAYTVRTHLVVSAGVLDIANLTTTIGIQSVNNFGSDKYNSTDNGELQYDVIKDPQHAMLSEASLDYTINKSALHVGRSQVNLDNQRFIGTVGWRQNERSYDTAYIANNSIENLNLLAAYVWGLQGVGAQATADTNTILLHGDYKVIDALSVTAYDYMIADKHDTLGIALTGNVATSGAKLEYRAEYAMQNNATMNIHGGTKAKADADYMNFDLGANLSGILAGINYEILSGKKIGEPVGGKTNFQPTLGTNHKFNGWADIFYVADNGGNGPTGGLQDMNIRLGYTAPNFGKILAVYHEFKADEKMSAAVGTTDDLGSEFDILYTNKLPTIKDLSALVKYASYSKGKATGYTNDKRVAWLMFDYKFATK
jgi:hypothetical protein